MGPRKVRGSIEAKGKKTPVEIALSIILIITSLVMILLVLLHKGKGGGLSDMFGGGVSGGLQGSSVVERNLDRISVVLSVIWISCIVGLALLYKHNV